MSNSDLQHQGSVAITTVAKKKSWSDLDLSLIRHSITKDIVPLKDDRAIKNAVKNLILTNFYERPFLPELGGNLSALLFEPADHITKLELKEGIKDVVSFYEPRVRLLKVDIKDNTEKNEWIVNVHFRILELKAGATVQVALKRLR